MKGNENSRDVLTSTIVVIQIGCGCNTMRHNATFSAFLLVGANLMRFNRYEYLVCQRGFTAMGEIEGFLRQ